MNGPQTILNRAVEAFRRQWVEFLDRGEQVRPPRIEDAIAQLERDHPGLIPRSEAFAGFLDAEIGVRVEYFRRTWTQYLDDKERGEAPRIETELAGLESEHPGRIPRSETFQRFLVAEIQVRDAKHDTSDLPQHYKDRFPEFGNEIDAVCAAAACARQQYAPQKIAGGISGLRAEFKDSATNRIGEFIKRQRIGAGSFGEVYLAEHWKTGEPVAIKIAMVDRTSPEVVRQVWRELKIVANLKHDHIVTVDGHKSHIPDLSAMPDDEARAAIQANPPYLVMEYVQYRQKVGSRPAVRNLDNLLSGEQLSGGRVIEIMLPQKNLWVKVGSGRAPRL